MRQASNLTATTLPNGTLVEFCGTTVGGEPFTTDTPLTSLLRRFAPPGWTQWLPPIVSISCPGLSNSLTVYLHAIGPTTPNVMPWAAYVAEDDNGFRYPKANDSCSFGVNGSLTNHYYGLTFDSYPRRQSHFQVKLLDETDNVVATFIVKTPKLGNLPSWNAAGLPQTQTNGSVALTLESFELTQTDQWAGVSLKTKVEATGTGWAHAQIRFQDLEDATGNRGNRLSPKEPVWKIDVFAYRESAEDFSDTERFILSDLPAPNPNEMIEINQSKTLDGVTLKVLALVPPGELTITNGTHMGFVPHTGQSAGSFSSSSSYGTSGISQTVETHTSGQPTLVIEISGLQLFDDLQVETPGPNNKPLVSRSIYGYQTGKRIIYRDIDWDRDLKTFNLELRISRPLPFTFFINPNDGKPHSR